MSDQPLNTDQPDRGELPISDPITAEPAPAERDAHLDRQIVPDVDRFAHRRAEPRLFAFFWTVYLIIVVLMGTATMGRGGYLSLSALAPRARLILVAIVAGATVACPMVRLSQARAARHLVNASIYDALVVALPIQMVIWPLQFLVGWPWDAAIGLAALLLVWPALLNALVALGLTWESRADKRAPPDMASMVGPVSGLRIVLMVLCLALLAAGPVWIAVTTSVAQTPRGRIPDWVWHASPFTSIYALTGSGLSGPRGPVSPGAWTMLGIVAGLATALWTLAWTNETPDREDQDRVN